MDNEEVALRLFLSADLMGSTALKSKEIGVQLKPLWLETFQDFYSEFPVIFSEKQRHLECGNNVKFWKGIGDELLWVATLAKGDDVIAVLRSFKLSLNEYNQKLEDQDKKVRLKGSAWIAGFPITHKKVSLPNDEHDYIGPYIDIGFRLSKFSTQMKMVISVDLAWLILKFLLHKKSLQEERDDLTLWLDKSEQMKGVLSGKPYPIIWIRCESKLEDLEHQLLNPPNGNSGKEWKEKLKDFCQAFIESTDDKIILPYILEDSLFGSPHKSYYEWDSQKTNKEPEDMSEPDNNESIIEISGEAEFLTLPNMKN